MKTMTQRFQRGRWSETRIKIDAMNDGDILAFPRSEYFNAKASVERLNDAYAGWRVWSMTTIAGAPRVHCFAPR